MVRIGGGMVFGLLGEGSSTFDRMGEECSLSFKCVIVIGNDDDVRLS